MNLSVCDPGVRALLVGAGEALGVYPLGCAPPTFHLAPGAYRRRGRSHTRPGGAAEATSGAIKWSAWLEKALDRDTLCSRVKVRNLVVLVQHKHRITHAFDHSLSTTALRATGARSNIR